MIYCLSSPGLIGKRQHDRTWMAAAPEMTWTGSWQKIPTEEFPLAYRILLHKRCEEEEAGQTTK